MAIVIYDPDKPMPEYYLTFGGRRKAESHTKFIAGQLDRLDAENRKVACADYREDYLKHGATVANENLVKFCDSFGISKAEIAREWKNVLDMALRCPDLQKHKFSEKIEELKKMKKRARPRIEAIHSDEVI